MRFGRALRLFASVIVALVLWLPHAHRLFAAQATPLARRRVADALLASQLAALSDDRARGALQRRMRRANPEWDFMGRTFLVLALTNEALRSRARRTSYLHHIDALIADTVRLERENGQARFLMAYAAEGEWVDPSGRSVFVDGELALMMAARQRVEVSERWRRPLMERVRSVAAQMRRGPVLSAESYPDECWTFCNTIALAALRASDSVTGEDHGDLLRRWVSVARAQLVDPHSGLLVSSFRRDGRHLDGPEGSSIFLSAHMLTIIDPGFARNQYRLARQELGESWLGFGWAREWPSAWRGPSDVDSGPIVPWVEASPGASGMALLGAAAFDDETWLRELHRSVALAAFPVSSAAGHVRYAASNQVGDAVMVYAAAQGPLFAAIGPPARRASAERGRVGR